MTTTLLQSITVLFSAFAAFAMVWWAYFKILIIAKEKNIVDNPDARKLQKKPVPVMGGIAIFIGIISGVIFGMAIWNMAGQGPETDLLPIIIAMGAMLYVGALDDIIGLSPISRLLIETLALLAIIFASGMCADSLHGLWGVNDFSWWIAVPLTVFAGAGIINGINMIDGVNGLSSGLCITCCALFGFIFCKIGDIANASLAFSMAAATLPFFIHNVFGLRSRMFIGDAGTMVMGILMAWFTICLLSSSNSAEVSDSFPNANMVAFCLAALSVPVFDTVRVMIYRISHGRSPFSPDKNHLHHAFIKLGFSHFFTALSEIAIDVAVLFCWAVSVFCGASADVQLYVTIAAALLFVCGTYMFISLNSHYHTRLLHLIVRLSSKTHLGRTGWWKYITEILDAREDRQNARTKAGRARLARKKKRKFEIGSAVMNGRDREAVLSFIKGKVEVFVDDIAAHSGASEAHVDNVLLELISEGRVQVIHSTPEGNMDIIAPVEEQ